jgi:hypothetical protein
MQVIVLVHRVFQGRRLADRAYACVGVLGRLRVKEDAKRRLSIWVIA